MFEGATRIDGNFEGEIVGEGLLILGPEADIRAEVQVQSLIVLGGRVRGEIRAKDLVEVHAQAIVEADIHAPQLFMEQGARFEGKCSMSNAKVESFEQVKQSGTPRLVAG